MSCPAQALHVLGIIVAVRPESLFAAAGSHTFGARLAEYLTLSTPDHDRFWVAYRAFQVFSPRAYLDVGNALEAVARRWPDDVARDVQARPELSRDARVLSRSLGVIDRADVRDLLLGAIEAVGPYDACRPSALRSLVRLGDPRLSNLLLQLIGTPQLRDDCVIAALDYGDKRLLPRLRRLVGAARTPPRRREQAYDAIAAISARHDLPPVAAEAWWRPLVQVPVPPGATTTAVRFQFVKQRSPLGRTAEGRIIRSPCDGLIEMVGPTLRIRPIPWDSDSVVRELYAAAGTDRHRVLLRQLDQFGAAAGDLIFSAREPAMPIATFGAADPREIVESLSAQRQAAAREWPDRFLQHLHGRASTDLGHGDVDALSEIDRPEARRLLLEVARGRGTSPSLRAAAIRGLAATGEPRLPDLLVGFVGSRSEDVRSAVADVALDFGDDRLLAGLRRIADSARRSGIRTGALDAIEAIDIRAGRVTRPIEQRRTVGVEPPHGSLTATVADVYVHRYQQVRAGEELAELVINGRQLWITAPINGTIINVWARPGHPPRPTLFRLGR